MNRSAEIPRGIARLRLTRLEFLHDAPLLEVWLGMDSLWTTGTQRELSTLPVGSAGLPQLRQLRRARGATVPGQARRAGV